MRLPAHLVQVRIAASLRWVPVDGVQAAVELIELVDQADRLISSDPDR